MESYKNLTIIGTSHISIESIREVESTLLTKKPDIVALELDKLRLKALLLGKRKSSIFDVFKIGIKAYLFNLIGAYIEKKLGKIVNIPPGSEMKKAIEIAKKSDIKIALIDQDIRLTLKKLSKNITWKEKFIFLLDIINQLFKRQKIEFDLTKVPDQKTIDKLISKLKAKYPSVHKILVEERNNHMAKGLYKLMQTNKDIVAVVGAGHEKALISIVKQNDKLH